MIKTNLQIIVHVLNTIATDLDTDSLDALITLGKILEGKEVNHDCRGRWMKELSELNPTEFAEDTILQDRMKDQIIADKIAKAESKAISGITNNINRNTYGAAVYNKFLIAFEGNADKASLYFDQAVELARSETEDTDEDFAPGIRGFGGIVANDLATKTGPQIIGDALLVIQNDTHAKIIPAIKLLLKIINRDEFNYDAVCRADWLKIISQILLIEYIKDDKLRELLADQIKTDKFVDANRRNFTTFGNNAVDPDKIALGQTLFNNLHRTLAKNSDVDDKGLEFFSAAVDMQQCLELRANAIAAQPAQESGSNDYSDVLLALVPVATVTTLVILAMALKLTKTGGSFTNWAGQHLYSAYRLFRDPEPETDEEEQLLKIPFHPAQTRPH